MHFEYRVLAAGDLAPTPSVCRMPSTRAKQYAGLLEQAFNELGSEGWLMVGSHNHPQSGEIYFVFQRERREVQGPGKSNMIRTMEPGKRE
jgi:hypothetical protein